MEPNKWVSDELIAENQKLIEENDKLRGLLAKGDKDCAYCGLKAEEIGRCASGFPGCARMDDIINHQETKTEIALQEANNRNDTLLIELENARWAKRIWRDMADQCRKGFREMRESSEAWKVQAETWERQYLEILRRYAREQ